MLNSKNAQGAGRKVLRGGGRLLAQSIKSRRQRRRRAGKRVVFPHLEDNLAAVRGRATTVNAPAISGSVSNVSNSKGLTVAKSEATFALQDSVAFYKTWIPAVAANEYYFPSLCFQAQQFQFYRFNGLHLEYAPNVGTNTAGRVAFATVATLADFNAINSWADMVALPKCYNGPVWTTAKYDVSPQMLSQQVKEWQVVYPESQVDYQSATQVQGFVVIAIEGTAATSTLTEGVINVSYSCTLTKSKAPSLAGGFEGWYTTTSTLDDTKKVSGANNSYSYSITTVDPATNTPDYRITISSRSNSLVVWKVHGGTGNINSVATGAANVNCTTSEYQVIGLGTADAIVVLLVKPTNPLIPHSFVITPTLGTGVVSGGYCFVRGMPRATGLTAGF